MHNFDGDNYHADLRRLKLIDMKNGILNSVNCSVGVGHVIPLRNNKTEPSDAIVFYISKFKSLRSVGNRGFELSLRIKFAFSLSWGASTSP